MSGTIQDLGTLDQVHAAAFISRPHILCGLQAAEEYPGRRPSRTRRIVRRSFLARAVSPISFAARARPTCAAAYSGPQFAALRSTMSENIDAASSACPSASSANPRTKASRSRGRHTYPCADCCSSNFFAADGSHSAITMGGPCGAQGERTLRNSASAVAASVRNCLRSHRTDAGAPVPALAKQFLRLSRMPERGHAVRLLPQSGRLRLVTREPLSFPLLGLRIVFCVGDIERSPVKTRDVESVRDRFLQRGLRLVEPIQIPQRVLPSNVALDNLGAVPDCGLGLRECFLRLTRRR